MRSNEDVPQQSSRIPPCPNGATQQSEGLRRSGGSTLESGVEPHYPKGFSSAKHRQSSNSTRRRLRISESLWGYRAVGPGARVRRIASNPSLCCVSPSGYASRYIAYSSASPGRRDASPHRTSVDTGFTMLYGRIAVVLALAISLVARGQTTTAQLLSKLEGRDSLF